MKNKINIDRLFQEKFKDFETEPNEQTWLNIQAALKEEKKEKRIVPIWFKYTGIAAAFFLGFLALNTFFKTTSTPKNTIILDKEIVASPTHDEDAITTKKVKDVKTHSKTSTQITENNDNNPKSTRKKSDPFSTKIQSKNNGTKTQHQNNFAVYQKEHNRPLEENQLSNKTAKSEKSLVEKSNQKNSIAIESSLNQNNDRTIANDKMDAKIAQSIPEIKEATTLTNPNELEELLKEKEGKKEKIAVTTQKNKWEIVPNVAPMFLNTNSNGSSIDPELSKNNKTADTGFSYGIGVNYALTKKIALRSGINAFSVGYNTNDVSYAAGLNTNSLSNVKFTSNKGVEIQNQGIQNSLSSDEKKIQNTNTGSINQKMGYYEVPLELSYAVLAKKFGIHLIGGVSTLFLNQNEIGLVSSESNFKLGEANNLNSIHFSTNFGIGLKYEFVKSFQLNFEPMIKYQFNTYSNETGNFKPVFIGLYSGISYRF